MKYNKLKGSHLLFLALMVLPPQLDPIITTFENGFNHYWTHSTRSGYYI